MFKHNLFFFLSCWYSLFLSPSLFLTDTDIPRILFITSIPDAQDVPAGSHNTPGSPGSIERRVHRPRGAFSTPPVLCFSHQGYQGRTPETFSETGCCCQLPELRKTIPKTPALVNFPMYHINKLTNPNIAPWLRSCFTQNLNQNLQIQVRLVCYI